MRRSLLRRPDRDEPVEIVIERGAEGPAERAIVSIDGRRVEVEVERRGRHSGWLRRQGRIVRFSAVRVGSAIEVWVDGRRHRFEILSRGEGRAADAGPVGAAGHLAAPMPGTVLKINAAAGDAYEAHEPLIVIESMKMEMALSSPRPGRVAEVLCAVGELVEMGAVLARLDPREETDAEHAATPG